MNTYNPQSCRYSSQWRAENGSLEIQPHPKEVIDVSETDIDKLKDRLRSSPKKYDLDKMGREIDDLEKKVRSAQGKINPSDLRSLKEQLEQLRRIYQSVYK